MNTLVFSEVYDELKQCPNHVPLKWKIFIFHLHISPCKPMAVSVFLCLNPLPALYLGKRYLDGGGL